MKEKELYDVVSVPLKDALDSLAKARLALVNARTLAAGAAGYQTAISYLDVKLRDVDEQVDNCAICIRHVKEWIKPTTRIIRGPLARYQKAERAMTGGISRRA